MGVLALTVSYNIPFLNKKRGFLLRLVSCIELLTNPHLSEHQSISVGLGVKFYLL